MQRMRQSVSRFVLNFLCLVHIFFPSRFDGETDADICQKLHTVLGNILKEFFSQQWLHEKKLWDKPEEQQPKKPKIQTLLTVGSSNLEVCFFDQLFFFLDGVGQVEKFERQLGRFIFATNKVGVFIF